MYSVSYSVSLYKPDDTFMESCSKFDGLGFPTCPDAAFFFLGSNYISDSKFAGSRTTIRR